MQEPSLTMESRPSNASSIFAAPLLSMTLGMIALDVLVAFESMAVTTVMPAVAAALNGLDQYALSFSITLAASIVGLVAGGRWSDDTGPHRAMSIGLLTFASGLIVAGASINMALFLVGRTLQGLGGGAILVAMYVMVARHYAESLHPRIFAALSTAWVLPALVGPVFAGWIAEHLHWRYVFLGAACLVAPCVTLLWPSLRMRQSGVTHCRKSQKSDATNRSASIWNASLAAVSLGGIGLAGQRHDAFGLLSVAAIGIAAWIFTRRLMPIGMRMMSRGIPAVIVMRGLVAAAFFGAEAFLPLLLTQQRGLSLAHAGIALSVGALGWSLAAWWQRDARIDRQRLLSIGSTCLLAGIAISASVLWTLIPVEMALVGWAVAGFGMGFLSASLSLLVLQLSPVDAQGRNSAAMRLMDAACTTAILAVAGSLFGVLSQAAAAQAFGVVFALLLIPATLALGLASRTSPTTDA